MTNSQNPTEPFDDTPETPQDHGGGDDAANPLSSLSDAVEGTDAVSGISEDDWLDANIGGGDDTTESDGPARGPDGKFIEKEDDDGDDDTTETEASGVSGGGDDYTTEPEASAEDDEPDDDRSDIEPEAFARAKAALKRAKWPDDIIEGMDAMRVVEIGSEIAESQRHSDGLNNQVKELKLKLADSEGGATDTEPSAEDSEPVGFEVDDLDGIYEKVRVEYGDELADVQKSISDRIVTKANEALTGMHKQVAQALAERDRATAWLLQQHESRELDSARERLKAADEAVADDETWNRVVEKARRLYKTGEYQDVRGAVDDAHGLVRGRELREEAVAERNKRNRRKMNGRPTPSRRQRSDASRFDKMTESQLEDQYLDALEDGDGQLVADLKQRFKSIG